RAEARSTVRRSIDLYLNHDTHAVIPAQAGIQQDKNAFYSKPLDTGLRRYDGIILFCGCSEFPVAGFRTQSSAIQNFSSRQSSLSSRKLN
ncbi:MAG: hypothetical protein WC053_07555, partial [Sideroxydans sp.]